MLPTNRGGLEPMGVSGIKSEQHDLDYVLKQAGGQVWQSEVCQAIWENGCN
jgi:hypothetical protein